MKQIIIIFLIQAISFSLSAHENGHGTPGKIWELKKEGTFIQADFIKEKNGLVYLSDKNHSILKFNIERFSEKDQQYILEKSNWIQTANTTKERTYLYPTDFSRWFIYASSKNKRCATRPSPPKRCRNHWLHKCSTESAYFDLHT